MNHRQKKSASVNGAFLVPEKTGRGCVSTEIKNEFSAHNNTTRFNSLKLLQHFFQAREILINSQIMATEECQEPVRNKWAACHFITYICPKIESGKGTSYWKCGPSTTWSRKGLGINDEKHNRLVSCLVDRVTKVSARCLSKK